MVNTIRKVLSLFIISLCVVVLKAQNDPAFTHYWKLEPSYNPASTGKTEKLNILAAYSAQLNGFENAPKTMYASADMQLPLGRTRHGIGVSFLNDEIGLFSHKHFSFAYNYKLKLFGGILGIGGQLDLLSESFDGTKVDMEEANDPAIPTATVDGSKIDFSAGLYYSYKKGYIGLSVLHTTAPVINLGESYQFEIDRTYYLTAGYNIKLRNPLLTMHPTLFAMYDGTSWLGNIGGRMEYNYEKKRLYGGTTYSIDRSIAFFIGGLFHGVDLSYSYEYFTTGVGLSNGAHEITVGYQFDLNLTKKGKNKHKSVRIL